MLFEVVFVIRRIYACLREHFELNYDCNLFDIVRYKV